MARSEGSAAAGLRMGGRDPEGAAAGLAAAATAASAGAATAAPGRAAAGLLIFGCRHDLAAAAGRFSNTLTRRGAGSG